MPASKKKIGVIVLGGHVQALGIVRVFGKNKIPTIVLDKTISNLARHSSYCSQFFVYTDVLEKLRSLAKDTKYQNWLLIPTDDELVALLSQNKSELSKYYTVAADDWDHVQVFYNKVETYELAKELSIDIPNTFFPKNEKDLKDMKLSFPCIIKPAVMHKFYSVTKKKVFLCNSMAELYHNYKKVCEIIPLEEIIIQEVIPGYTDSQYSICFYFNQIPLVTIAAIRKRQHPLLFGNATTFAKTVEDPGIVESSSRLLSSVGYKGICEVEYKLDRRDGKFKLLEVNPRTWKWHYISTKANTPFLLTMYNDLVLGERTVNKNWLPAVWQDIVTDIPVLVSMLIKRIPIIPSFAGCSTQAVWDIHDIKPFLMQLMYLRKFISTR